MKNKIHSRKPRWARLFSLVVAINFLFISTVQNSYAAVPKTYAKPARLMPRVQPQKPPPRPKPQLRAPVRPTHEKSSIKIPPPAKPAHIKKGSKKVKLIQPKFSFSAHPTDFELTNTRAFLEPLAPLHSAKIPGENDALAKALIAYKSKTDPEDTSDLHTFLRDFSKSRWAPAIKYELGSRLFETGYLTEALNQWKSAWEMAEGEKNGPQRDLANNAIGNFLILNARLGHKDDLKTFLGKTQKRSFDPSAEEKIYRANIALACMEKRPDIAFKCGPFAVDSLVSAERGKLTHTPLMFTAKSTEKGTNLAQLKDWADKLGLHYTYAKRSKGAPYVVPSIMHWKLGHFATIAKTEGKRYRIKDPTFGTGGNIAISSRALEEETDGYFLVPNGPLPKGWQVISRGEAESVWGKGYPTSQDPKECDQPKTEMGTDSGGSCGLAKARAYSMQATLNIQDVPLSYSPPIGPKMDFSINYDHLEENTTSNPPFPNFGNTDWTLNWVSYLTVDSSSNATVRIKGGGSEYFAYPYQPGLYSQAQLVNVSTGVYQRQLPDGSIEVFNQSDGSGRIFMTEVIDPQGNSATIQYDSNFRITTITDAIGQQSTLSYLSNTLGNAGFYIISQITDPFGRSCYFTYNTSYSPYQLTASTDVLGLVSNFTYNNNNNNPSFIDSMTTPYGTTGFFAYNPVINPTFFVSTGLQFLFPDGTTSLIINGFGPAQTYFWDREAMARYPSDRLPDLSYNIDTSHCTTTKWCFSGGPFPDFVQTAVPYWIKPALDNQITYAYPGGAPGTDADYILGTSNQPTSISRTVSGSTTQTWQYTYNSWGHVTQSIDPVGRTFSYTYDTNGIDLLEKDQTASSTHDINGIWASYSQHLPGTYKDGSGQTTSYTYNSFGELATSTDPASAVWTYSYDSNGYLTQIQGPLSGSSDTTTISYDGYGRIYQVTDAEGYTLTYSYDLANRVTQITYPDGTSDQTIYDKRDAVLITDRIGRCTQRSYNSVDQLAFEIDPMGRKTQYKWCNCGALMSLTDPNGNKTSWHHDLQGRVIQKNYADQSSCAYTYDAVGRKSSRTDALGQTTNYSYNLDNTLSQVSYSSVINPTSTVTYTYDPYYVRLTSVANGWGTNSYSYNPYITSSTSTTTGAGKVSSATNSVISMTFPSFCGQ